MGVMVKDWSSITEPGDTTLKQDDASKYFTFTGISSNEQLDDEKEDVKIGIYQVGDVEASVYAFASTMTDAVVSAGAKIKVGGADPEQNNATLIASGSGTLSSDKTSVENIQITLEAPEGDKIFKKLGFSGENITKITGSTGDDTIYIISSKEKNGVSKEAVLDFSQKGKDNVIFSGSTTITSINPTGGGGRKYTHPRGPDR